jgi:FixJ family two-component response regulator
MLHPDVARDTMSDVRRAATARVFVVDSDIAVRDALQSMIGMAGWHVETFASGCEFMARPNVAAPGCLVVDMSLPDISGLDLQRRVAQDRPALPIVFITGQGDIPTTVQAMKAGAVEFLTKPVHDERLLAAIGQALELSEARLRRDLEIAELRRRHSSLTPREAQVLERVVAGWLNKQIAFELEISEITVKAHRGRVMCKMEAGSLADLVRIASRLGIGAMTPPAPDRRALRAHAFAATGGARPRERGFVPRLLDPDPGRTRRDAAALVEAVRSARR